MRRFSPNLFPAATALAKSAAVDRPPVFLEAREGEGSGGSPRLPTADTQRPGGTGAWAAPPPQKKKDDGRFQISPF